MAASVLHTTAASALGTALAAAAIAPTELSKTAVSKEEIYTVNDLLRTRARGENAHQAIVAYPTSGTDYAYYTPFEVGTSPE